MEGGLFPSPDAAQPSREHTEQERALDAALRFLGSRPRSEAEVRRRLECRFPSPVVETVLLRLRDLSYLDDTAFAQWWREQRERHRPRGAVAIRQELRRLGVAPETVHEVLAGLDEDEAALRAGEKQAKSLRALDQRAFLQRLIPYLQRRGFSPGTARRAALALWQAAQGES